MQPHVASPYYYSIGLCYDVWKIRNWLKQIIMYSYFFVFYSGKDSNLFAEITKRMSYFFEFFYVFNHGYRDKIELFINVNL